MPVLASDVSAIPDGFRIRAGALERTLGFAGGNITTAGLAVDGRELLAQPGSEVSFTLSHAEPNQRPAGLTPDGTPPLDSSGLFRRVNDTALYEDRRPNAPRWVAVTRIESRTWGSKISSETSQPKIGVTRLTVHAGLAKAGLEVAVLYEVYDGYAAIRKWVEISNHSNNWVKIDHLALDDIRLADIFRHRTPLTAADYGAEASVVGFTNREGTHGIIAASEIPSALHHIDETGEQGYRDEFFEWVLGPGETFVSEPVFQYGFAGESWRTISAISTPLDRTVEGPYMRFVRQILGIASDHSPFVAPQWLTWASFGPKIDDAIVRQSADILARAGFAQMLLDDGWQKGRLGTVVNTATFPDFAATTAYVRSKGLTLGLWLSCFRDVNSPDLQAMPENRILPAIMRNPSLPGLAMSFASPWRHYFAQDLVTLARRYGVTYYKQDFTNILAGDLAEGHESRTRKESLLRALRGLLAAQDEIRENAPEVTTELTHEIYWGTPGIAADLAALKHASQFHIPPNDPRGDFRGPAPASVEAHRADLRAGCWMARQRFYACRGLPLYPLEYYAAVTKSFEGSLTTEIQDRQIASWLLGAPLNFSGDLRTLSEQNIAHYRRRFEALAALQKRYDIYHHFQFSGVPEPTDTDWHWWGKLNEQGNGAVVVVRGSGGAARRAVNIPWVLASQGYHVIGVFTGKDYGAMDGKQLQERGVPVTLPAFGQELLEIAPR
jgi:hypothetical protein